jgi:hypothetical protein
MKRIYILLSILVIVFLVFSADRNAQLQNNMYPQKALAVKSTEPSIISLSAEDLAFHHTIAILLMNSYGVWGLSETIQMFDMHESYARVLYKVGAVIKTETDSAETVVYYVYVFLNKNTDTKKLTVQSLHVVCLWENDKIILNCGFKKDCTVINKWLYWENENCPSVGEMEHELEKAFNFEQIKIGRKKEKKEYRNFWGAILTLNSSSIIHK